MPICRFDQKEIEIKKKKPTKLAYPKFSFKISNWHVHIHIYIYTYNNWNDSNGKEFLFK